MCLVNVSLIRFFNQVVLDWLQQLEYEAFNDDREFVLN